MSSPRPHKRLKVSPDFNSFAANFNLLIITVYSLLILLGSQQFTLWESRPENPLQLLFSFHSEALQQFAIFPPIWAAQVLHINEDQAFSFYVLGCMFVLCSVLGRSVSTLMKKPIHNQFFTTCFLILLLPSSLLIGAQLIFALLGIAVIMFAQLRFMRPAPEEIFPNRLFLVRTVLGLLFASVDAGAFTIGMSMTELFIIGMLIIKLIQRDRLLMPLIWINFAVLALFLPSEIPLLVSNYKQVGGLVFSFSSLTLVYTLMHLQRNSLYAPLIMAGGFSVAFGLLGGMTSLMILPALAVFGLRYLAIPFTK